jgi:hypothetical protein
MLQIQTYVYGVLRNSLSEQPLTLTCSMMGMEYKGIIYGLRKIVVDEGWLGFFKVLTTTGLISHSQLQGNGTNVIRIAPYSAVQFYSFETAKRVACRSLYSSSALFVFTSHFLALLGAYQCPDVESAGSCVGVSRGWRHIWHLSFCKSELEVTSVLKYPNESSRCLPILWTSSELALLFRSTFLLSSMLWRPRLSQLFRQQRARLENTSE